LNRVANFLAVFLQVVILLAVAIFWWNRVNEDMNGGISGFVGSAILSIRSWIDNFLAAPGAQQFRAWQERYWGNVEGDD